MKKQHLPLLVLSVLLLTSCATIISGTRADVVIDGDAPEPLTIVADEQTFDSVSLPASISIRRKSLTNPIKLTSPSYEYSDVIPGRSTNHWVWANYFNMFFGLPVDLISDAIYKPALSRYYINKRSKNEGVGDMQLQPVGVYYVEQPPVSREQCYYRHEVSVLLGLGSSVWRGSHSQQLDYFYDVEMENSFFCGIDVRGVSWDIRYFYHFNPRLAVGAAFGKARAYDKLVTPYDERQPEANALPYYAHVHTRSTFAMPAVKYSWIYDNAFSVYSMAALGAQYSHTWASVHSVQASLFPEIQYEHHRQEVFNKKQWKLAPQLTAVGIDFGGRHFRAFAELGYGIEGVFNIGLNYRFHRISFK